MSVVAKTLTVNWLRFHVEDEGEGRPVILLHGFPDTSRLWRNQVSALTAAGFRCIAPDLRGRGRTERPGTVAEYGLATMVGDVTGVLDALHVERAAVIGHDWGAALAWLVASLAPDRVERLVAISVGFPGAAGLPRFAELQQSWYRILIQFEGLAEDLFQQDDGYLAREFLHGQGDFQDYLAVFADREALTAGFNWYRANLPVERLLTPIPDLPPVQTDTLGIFGAADAYVSERTFTASEARVAGSWRYERLDGVGHFVPLEAPDRLNELLLAFLA